MEKRDSAFNLSIEQLPSGWDIKELIFVADINKNSLSKDTHLKDIEYIDISSVGTRVLETTTSYNINNAPSRAKRIINDGDTIISTVRPNRKSYLYIQNPKKNMIASTGFAVISPKNINKNYLHYYLTSNGYINYLVNNSTGSAYPAVNADIFKKSYIIVPKEDDAKKIGDFLKSIDDKIELNNEINKILEEMAQLLYNQWFVEFEFSNENGQPYKSSGGEMVESELGKIPLGWEVGSLGDSKISNIIKSGIDDFDGTKKYIATADVDLSCINKNVETMTCKNKKSRANMQPVINSIWFAKMKDSNKHMYLDDFCLDLLNEFIFSTGFVGINCKENSLYYLLNFINDFKFEIKKDSLCNGSTMKSINNDSLNKINIVIPTQSLLIKFNNSQKKIFNKIYLNNLENYKLKETRDLLIHKLMTNEIDLEKFKI